MPMEKRVYFRFVQYEKGIRQMKQKLDFTKTGTLTLTALFCCFLWGSAFPSIKIGYSLFGIAGSDTSSQILFAGTRFFIAGLLAILFGSLIKGRLLLPKKSSLVKIFILSLVQTVLQYVFFYIGLAHTSGVKASIIEATNVFAALIVSAIFFKETLSSKKIFGCIIGFIGIVIINLNGAGFSFAFTAEGEGAIALSAIMYAVSSALIKSFSKDEDPFSLAGYQFLVGGLVMMLIGKSLGGIVSGFTPKSTALLIYMGFISAAAYSLWALLLRDNPISRVTIFGFTNPMFGVLLSALLLGEKNQAFTLRGLISLIFVCTGILIVNAPAKQK